MAVKDTPWGRWDHISLPEVVALFQGLRVPWWIAGGYAIDAFAGDGRRDHDDIDVSLFFSDHMAAREHLDDWDLHYADPPGTLVPWARGMELPARVHDIWVRRKSSDSWRFQLMLNPGGPDTLVFRRNPAISWPFEEATWLRDGVRYLKPEIQLLYKSRSARHKDEQDFEDCLPLLNDAQWEWLRESLAVASPGHPWIGRLMGG